MTKKGQKPLSFCEVCKHSVMDMERHIKTVGHKRNLDKQNGVKRISRHQGWHW